VEKSLKLWKNRGLKEQFGTFLSSCLKDHEMAQGTETRRLSGERLSPVRKIIADRPFTRLQPKSFGFFGTTMVSFAD
jgi:hypothetical protein